MVADIPADYETGYELTATAYNQLIAHANAAHHRLDDVEAGKQPLSTNLTKLAAVTRSPDRVLMIDGAAEYYTETLTTAADKLLTAYSPMLRALGQVDWTEDTVLYRAADGTITPTAITQLARQLLDDTSEGTMRQTLDAQRAFRTGTATTAAGTASKTVTLDSPWGTHIPVAGDWFVVTFSNGISVNTPKLSINGTTEREIRTPTGNNFNSSVGSVDAGGALLMRYDGTYYRVTGATSNSTYGGITAAEIINTAHTTGSLITGQRAEDLMVNEATKSRELTNKTITNPSIKNYTESVVAIGNTGSAKTISLTSGTVQKATLTANCTFTMPAAGDGKSFVLYLYTGAGGFTATFTGVKWAGGSVPVVTVTASRMDAFSFWSDGTNWYGSTLQNFTP